jgi:uncharacterized protein YjiS (DUF1127 family)
MASVLVRGRPVAVLGLGFVAVVASWFAKARVTRQQTRALEDLRAMDSYLLDDLGINRADLFDAGLAERPMRLLSERRARRAR